MFENFLLRRATHHVKLQLLLVKQRPACSLCRFVSVGSSERSVSMEARTQQLVAGICGGDRAALARGITLGEPSRAGAGAQSRHLVTTLMAHCRQQAAARGKANIAFRIGLSGPPGAGKSTFTEVLGKRLTDSGHRVAVLAVDPSSGATGGSILGDKTRMPELSRDMRAFIRPSPSRGHLGGVTRTTNEAIVLCEAAGYDIVLVETVGVGQSEHQVRDMLHMFCLLLPPAGGDELQGIKRGIVEQSDLIVVNKYDGDLKPAARRVAYEYMSALKYIRPTSLDWRPEVKLCSSLEGDGVAEVWDKMTEFREKMTECGELEARRRRQHLRWMWSYVEERLVMMAKDIANNAAIEDFEQKVREDVISPGAGADAIIQLVIQKIKTGS